MLYTEQHGEPRIVRFLLARAIGLRDRLPAGPYVARAPTDIVSKVSRKLYNEGT
jgi:hypothetical protein